MFAFPVIGTETLWCILECILENNTLKPTMHQILVLFYISHLILTSIYEENNIYIYRWWNFVLPHRFKPLAFSTVLLVLKDILIDLLIKYFILFIWWNVCSFVHFFLHKSLVILVLWVSIISWMPMPKRNDIINKVWVNLQSATIFYTFYISIHFYNFYTFFYTCFRT